MISDRVGAGHHGHPLILKIVVQMFCMTRPKGTCHTVPFLFHTTLATRPMISKLNTMPALFPLSMPPSALAGRKGMTRGMMAG
jgi:hypothetical protein